MRFFLKIKHNEKQLGIKRIESKQEIKTTDEIIKLIEESLNIQNINFIPHLLHEQNKTRIVKGWKLEHYHMKSGMQIDIELLPMAAIPREGQPANIGEVLFNKKSMQKIIEEDEEDDEKSNEISVLVLQKYEDLLKYIQTNKTDLYLKQIQADHPSLGPCENEFYKKELRAIQNELGDKGWAAIHYSVFSGNLEILEYLIQIGVDLNIKTSDEWLPIQLAVREENLKIVQLLTVQPSLNLNICTSHGLVMNMAVQSGNMQIIPLLLMKDVNFSAKDHLGRTVYDMLGTQPNKDIEDLLRSEERRQSITGEDGENAGVLYHALVSSFRGEVLCVKSPPRKDKMFYICIDPYEKVLKIFEERNHYPQYPKEMLPISLINKFAEMSKNEKSWYMKNDIFYFIVSTPKSKYTFACSFKETVERWINAFKQCSENVRMYPDSIVCFERNDSVIQDLILTKTELVKSPSKSSKNLMNLFISQCSSESDSKTPERKQNEMETCIAKSKESSENSLKNGKIPQKDHEAPTKGNEIKQSKEKIEETKNNNENKLQSESENLNKNSLKFSDFKILKILGQGSFGTVFLAMDLRNPERKKQYALKCFKKKKLIVNKQIKYTIAELNILKQLSHPFIVNLHFTFQTPNYVYLGLDFCPKMDLSHHLMNEVTFPEKEAKIYAAEILLALEYLHEKNIIYRDLKPENIMLDEQGHVRLVDFGLSKQGQDRDFLAKSFCGSPAYLSPEMLVKQGVGKESDFYCLGAVLYEMITGEPPFFSDDITTLYYNISKLKLTFPKGISENARDLLTGLLEKNPQKRLGYKGSAEIKAHSFFKDINWESLMKKTIPAPVREEVDEEEDEHHLEISNSHQDFDYSAENYRVNRFINFSFVREDETNS